MTERRIVVVGLGSIGKRHARLLVGRGDVDVDVVEPDAAALQRATEEIGDVHAVHPSLDHALASAPDCALIATPHNLHADQTIAALEAGCHVLCEKPMADTLENAKRMQQAAAQSDRIVSIGFTMHHIPSMIRFREVVRSGKLGHIVHIHMYVGTYQTLVFSISRHQAHVEGALLMDYAHQPDLLYWMLERHPKGVYAAGGQGGNRELQSNPNHLAIVCDYDVPMVATIHLNYVESPNRGRYEAIGDRGWVCFDPEAGHLTIGDHADDSSELETFPTARDELYEAEHQGFFDAIDGKRATESPPHEAIASMYVIDAAMRSWKSKQRVGLEI